MKKTLKQKYSTLKTETIDSIGGLIGKRLIFTKDHPILKIEGDYVEIKSIVKVDGDIYVHGVNLELEFDNDVELDISEIELLDLIDIYESIDNIFNLKK